MTSPSRKKPPTTAAETPVDAEHGDAQRGAGLAHTSFGWPIGLLIAFALVSSVDADKPAADNPTNSQRQPSAIASSPRNLEEHQGDAKTRMRIGWTQPKSLQDSADTLKWVKPKQARMAEIHRPRPSYLRASVKATPVKIAVPSVAETGGFVRLASAQVPIPEGPEDAAEVFSDDDPINLEDLLGDDSDDEGFQLPGELNDGPDALEDGNGPADNPPIDQVVPTDQPLDQLDPIDQILEDPMDDLDDTEPSTSGQLPELDDGGLPGDLPTPDNGPSFPEVEPTPLDRPGDSIELEPLSDEISSVFNGRDCPAEERIFHEAWDEMRRSPISSISLDITPSIRPTEPEKAEATRSENMAEAPFRVWRDRRGRVLAEGQMVNYSNAQVLVETKAGTEELSWYALGNEDLCFVSSWWELPSEFSAATNEYVPRDWTLTTFTWTASALSHKPLYFEEVQLERYGHSSGPIKQPILSGVHFFGNIFFLPYKMGLTPPTECQYALGYYRPGSCAPWLLPAVPLSARGARWQLAAVIGALAVFP